MTPEKIIIHAKPVNFPISLEIQLLSRVNRLVFTLKTESGILLKHRKQLQIFTEHRRVLSPLFVQEAGRSVLVSEA